eukprot:1616593-Ditylum_brightwellii.AAC.1
MELLQFFSYVVKNNHDNNGLQTMYSYHKYGHNYIPSTACTAAVRNKCHNQSKENLHQGLTPVNEEVA